MDREEMGEKGMEWMERRWELMEWNGLRGDGREWNG